MRSEEETTLAEYVVWFEALGMGDVDRVGGKNASLGEMISHLSAAGVQVPGGFATTAEAFREFLTVNGIIDRINAELAKLDIEDVNALAETGARVRQWVIDAPFQPALAVVRWAHRHAPMRRAAPVIHHGRGRVDDHADGLVSAPPLAPEASGTWGSAPGGPSEFQDAWGRYIPSPPQSSPLMGWTGTVRDGDIATVQPGISRDNWRYKKSKSSPHAPADEVMLASRPCHRPDL